MFTRFAKASLTLLLAVGGVMGDIYMQNPRGSNNRLNERSANRDNGNRLFDSQNNNRGGYNVGDKSANAFDTNNPYAGNVNEHFDYSTASTGKTSTVQYSMAFYEQSKLHWEWTAQHGCGGNEIDAPHMTNCNMVLEYMCENPATAFGTVGGDQRLAVKLYDGGNTGTPDQPGNYADSIGNTRTNNNNNKRGRQESEAFYYACKKTRRNRGLFLADQLLNGNSAQYTRQNPNGERRGLECPEERDYYPWWNPSPWVSIAYLTDHMEHCNTIVAKGNQNNNTVWFCAGLLTQDKEVPITQTECTTAGGTWTSFNKNMGPNAFVDCKPTEFTRVNHLGNGVGGEAVGYDWTLPKSSDLAAWGYTYETISGTNQKAFKCVARLRYNISTDDYNPWTANATMNNDPVNLIYSPVVDDPRVNIGTVDLQGLALAINTAQFGRTFQDRSHIFWVVDKPAGWANKKVLNLNVRGKRGNIVQTFPAVEYDFIPTNLKVDNAGDLVHIQWTGSNTHNNGDPAGDGQAGDAGEGTTGTDRSNFVLMGGATNTQGDRLENYPMPLDKNVATNLFKQVAGCYTLKAQAATSASDANKWVDCALILATSGEYRARTEVTDTTDFDELLNNSPASLIGGIVLDFNSVPTGTYNYMCTRNNNFSNRSQKGSIIVM